MGYCRTPDGQDRSLHPMLGERVQGALDRWADLWLRGVQVTCGDWWPPVSTNVDNGATWSCLQKTGPYHMQSLWGQGGASGAFLSITSHKPVCARQRPRPHTQLLPGLGSPSCLPHFSDTNRILWTPPPPPVKTCGGFLLGRLRAAPPRPPTPVSSLSSW